MNTLINWNNIPSIFDNKSHEVIHNLHLLPIYVDNDTVGTVNLNHFDRQFEQIDNFIPDVFELKNIKISVDDDPTDAIVKRWFNTTVRMEIWKYFNAYDEGYCIIFGSNDTYLITGNKRCHPFIITPNFDFVNSDGSTFDGDLDIQNMDLDAVKSLMKNKTVEYIFNQIH